MNPATERRILIGTAALVMALSYLNGGQGIWAFAMRPFP